MLGYVGPVTQEEWTTPRLRGRAPSTPRPDRPERTEEQYDATLRGTDGIRTVTVDNSGKVTGTASTTQPRPGDTLVTSIDANVQKLAEAALAAQIKRAGRRSPRRRQAAAPAARWS